MAYKGSYTKDIEEYFLLLAGKGIMLSSKDYDLISKWKRRGVPKEVVLKGIRKGFSEGGGSRDHKGLSDLAPFIEDEIKDHGVEVERGSEGEDKEGIVRRITERLSAIIRSESRGNIKRHYIEVRKRVLGLLDSDIEEVFESIRRIEEGFYQDFFLTLPKNERDRIMMEAEERVGKRARYMTEHARRESVLSFRNDILKREYGLKSIVAGG